MTPRVLLLQGLFMFLGSSTGFAQVDTGAIAGTVRDQQGAVIPGASVTVTNDRTGATFDTITSGTGDFRADLLATGTYRVSVSLPGFKTQIKSGAAVHLQEVARVDFTLEVGEVTEEVTVTAENPLLESETTSTGNVVAEQAVKDLPLNERNYALLAKLGAGVQDPGRGDRGAEGGSFVANGVRASLNNWVLDGVDNNAKIVDIQNSSNQAVRPSVDAIEEFKVQTHNFSAEHAHSAGAVINVRTKSGSNEFHGSAFEFHRNDNLDGRNFFQPPDQPKGFRLRNQFGGTIGGPIIRDKAFFFASYERLEDSRGIETDIRTVPTAIIKQGDFSGRNPIFDPATTRPNPKGKGFIRNPFPGNIIPADRIDPTIAKIVALIPPANVPGAGLKNNFASSPVESEERDQYDFRIDYIFSSGDKLFGRYSLGEPDRVRPGPFPPPLVGSDNFQQANKSGRGQGVALGWTRTISSTILNEVRFGYNRVRDNLTPFATEFTPSEFGFKGIPEVMGVTGLPKSTVSGYAVFGEATFLPNSKISEAVSVGDIFSWQIGSHSMKTGFNFRWVRSWFAVSGAARGNFTFNGAFTQDPQSRAGTGDAFADFLLGIPVSSNVDTVFTGDLRYKEYGAFFQDDWKVTPKLTLNLGVRWDFIEPPFERDDRQANFLVDQRKLIFPDNQIPDEVPPELATMIPDGVKNRGLLESDTNNFAPRLGLAYRFLPNTVLRVGGGIFFTDAPAIGASGRLPANPPFRPTANFPTDETFPLVTVGKGFPADALVPSEVTPATAFRAFPTDFPQAYAAHWNLDIQHQFSAFLLDVGYTGTKGTQLPMGVNFNQQFPGPGSVASRRPIQGIGNITGQLPGNNSSYNALLVEAKRRFSEGFSFLAAYTYSHAIDIGGEQLLPDSNFRDVRNLRGERSSSLIDVTHRFSFSNLWELPVGRGKPWDLGSPLLNNIFGNWQVNSIVTLQSGKVFTPSIGFNSARTGSPRPDRIRDGRPGEEKGFEKSLGQYFDKSAFAAATPFAFGNAGKNILRGPSFANFDMSFFKSFPIPQLGEQGLLQFRSEFFNIFNHPQFGLPNTRIDLPQGGSITSLAGNMRQIQFALKLFF